MKNNKEEKYSYYGQIQVKKISEKKIVMTFYVCKGAPSYNSGSFAETLVYKNNQAIYTCPDYDKSCKITFDFLKNGIEVRQKTKDFYGGCGFGSSVVADGFYKVVSRKTPILKHPMTEEKL